MRKSALSVLLVCILLVGLQGCDILNSSKTKITVTIIDSAGDGGECNLRIIKPDPAYWKNVYSKMIHLSNTNSHTFEDVKPGDYAGLIGTISETYREFSIDKGEQITLEYTYYVSAYVNVGGYTVPYKTWKYRIIR